MDARAYLLKPCSLDRRGRPSGLLAKGASFAATRPGLPEGMWIAVRSGDEGEPPWAALVQPALRETPDLGARTAPGALIVVAVPDVNDQFVGFCFGSGRFLLRRSAFVVGFGMRVALNAAVKTGVAAVEAISWVSYRTNDAAPVDGRLRASVPKALVGYGVSPGIDRVRGVRVQRLDPRLGVGRSLEGISSLAVDAPEEINALTRLAVTLWKLQSAEEFRATWPHVDDLLVIEDAEERAELEKALEQRLNLQDFDGIYLGLPDEAEGHRSVRYGSSKVEHDEYAIATALGSWRGSLESLKARGVTFVFSDGRPDHAENLFDLIVTTELLDGEEVHLTDGEWFRVRAGLLKVVDDALDAIPVWDVEMPAWAAGTSETEYLKGATAERPDLVLMDRRNVLAGGATAMEMCDIAHVDGAMVHVKKRDTKGLSHLTAQLFGSATRWARELEYRRAVVERLAEQAVLAGRDRVAFETVFNPSAPRQGRHPQVFAIGAEWGRRKPSEVLTTLVKIQLFRACSELASRGFDVLISRIELEVPPKRRAAGPGRATKMRPK